RAEDSAREATRSRGRKAPAPHPSGLVRRVGRCADRADRARLDLPDLDWPQETTGMASAPAAKSAPFDQVGLAFERTYLAHERTLMAWIRTAASLITFGFTLFKYFQYLH